MSACAKPESSRWWKWAVSRRRVLCPSGHPVPIHAEFLDASSGFIACRHWDTAEKRECNRWMFLLAVTGGGSIIAEVTLDEKAKMRQLSTPSEMLDFLGIFPD